MCLALALAAFVLTGCSFGQPLTPADIQQHGTKVFDAPSSDVLEAAVAALEAQGYEIARKDAEKGIIQTKPKLVRAAARGSAEGSTAIEYTRRYRLRLSAKGKGTEVAAKPSVFAGSSDISQKEVWAIQGAGGEIELWNQLFREIADNL